MYSAWNFPLPIPKNQWSPNISNEHNQINILPSAESFFQKYNPTNKNKTIPRNKNLFTKRCLGGKDIFWQTYKIQRTIIINIPVRELDNNMTQIASKLVTIPHILYLIFPSRVKYNEQGKSPDKKIARPAGFSKLPVTGTDV